jgi:hypothetical protein
VLSGLVGYRLLWPRSYGHCCCPCRSPPLLRFAEGAGTREYGCDSDALVSVLCSLSATWWCPVSGNPPTADVGDADVMGQTAGARSCFLMSCTTGFTAGQGRSSLFRTSSSRWSRLMRCCSGRTKLLLTCLRVRLLRKSSRSRARSILRFVTRARMALVLCSVMCFGVVKVPIALYIVPS